MVSVVNFLLEFRAPVYAASLARIHKRSPIKVLNKSRGIQSLKFQRQLTRPFVDRKSEKIGLRFKI